MMIKRKQYLDQIRPFIGKDIIKVIVGLRRSGKSVILEQLKEEIGSNNSIYLNFEDISNQPLCTASSLNSYITSIIDKETECYYLFFDEIQEVKDWEKVINSLRVSHNTDIYITGSNSKLLSGELATYIAGRYVSFTIYPFSYKEFLQTSNNLSFEDYIKQGGMPFLSSINYDFRFSKQYLQDVYHSVVLKDIVKRYKIRDVDLLERIIVYALANIGHCFSATSISKFLKSDRRKVAPETVLNYLRACEESYLLCRFKSYDLIEKKALSVSEKYYVSDHGLREAVIGSNLTNIEIILENIVALELLRRGYDLQVGRIGDREIDFVAGKEGKKIYVQVCYLLLEESTIDREFRSLLDIDDNYEKYVLYRHSSFQGDYKGILCQPIDEWLLS